MTIRMRILISMLVLWAVVPASAEVLVVTTDGKSCWATSARKEGDAVLYLDKETGEEKKALLSTLDGVIPIVQRGKAYKPEEIQKNLENLKKLKQKHGNLTRQLNELLQGWEALSKPSPEFENQITNGVQEFAASDKGPKIYKKVTLDLSMIKFKDVQGVFASRIDAVCEEIRKEYVATNLVRLVRMAADPKLGAEGFVPLKRLADPVLEAAAGADKDKIKALVGKSRLAAFDVTLKQVDGLSASGKSVDAYLKSSALLFLVKKEVADTAEQKAGVEKKITTLRDGAGRSLAGYTLFDNGFPMTDDDEQVLVRTRSFSSRVTFTSLPLDEQCLMVPAQSPGRLQLRQPFSLPVRLIFNCAQPTNRVFGVVVTLPGTAGQHTHVVKLAAFPIQKGHADITVRDDFSAVEPGFELGSDKRGATSLYLHLACLDDQSDATDAAQAQWNAISGAWRFSIGR